MVDWADRFNQATLDLHPDADIVWNNRMNTAKLTDGDWEPIFVQAVDVNPTRRALYESAMCSALDRWGGDAALRTWIQGVAREKNPNARWAETLRERWEKENSSVKK